LIPEQIETAYFAEPKSAHFVEPKAETTQQHLSREKDRSSIVFVLFFLFGIPVALLLSYVSVTLTWIVIGLHSALTIGWWLIAMQRIFSNGMSPYLDGNDPTVYQDGG
jgi:hypothetical protein